MPYFFGVFDLISQKNHSNRHSLDPYQINRDHLIHSETAPFCFCLYDLLFGVGLVICLVDKL